MALAPINWNPDRATLTGFSEAWMCAFGMALTPLLLWRDRPAAAVACWCAAVVGRVVGQVRPEWLKPVFVGLTLATRPIGWVISHAALAIVFFLVVTPIGLVFRLRRRDSLQRSFDRQADSYWEPYAPDREPNRYLRPF